MCAWMGPEFRMAWPCALLVMIPDILIFSEQVANTAAIASNLVKQQACGYVLMAVVCVLFSFPLSRALGAPGAAAAIAIAYLTLFVYNNILYSRKMKLNMWNFIKECYGKLILPILAVGCISYFLCNSLILINGWKGVMIKAVIVSLLYLFAVLTAVTEEERKFVLGLFKKRKKS